MTGCQQCGSCCRWIGFSFNDLSGKALEFYTKRGCEILKSEHGEYRIYVPCICVHLKDNKCTIYDQRPLVCIEGVGYEDPICAEDCKWKHILTSET